MESRDSAVAATADSERAEADESTSRAAELVTEVATGSVAPRRLAAMLSVVGGSVRDDDHLAVLLKRTAEIAHEAVDGASSVGVSILFGGLTYTAVHTDDRTLEVDRHQYEIGEGPCLEAARTGEIVRVDVDAAQQRWPEFVHAAREEGVRSFLAAPLHTADMKLGSFNLYGTAPDAFGSIDESILELLTSTVSTAIGDYARVRSAREVASGLQDALEHRAPIEQAKGILMALHGVDSDTAFGMLSAESQRANRKLRDIARDFVESVSRGE
ncbi:MULTISPECIES: GAF and ANTAR domain-containing protein [unclassified Rhodococcus (in: high G+C Gram-positive bacteria)]|uniref:GAF and ANTAR domain-containing protein n=1 Tax=unclassified Rhodococcus (in: high G+C Gram-positive bacteria) TaxID=192944 RepID=UPI0006FB4B60|nr:MULTISPECIES: GAF and ANTAR domain-containing protein [unclassified Rhodococcus (in: high G+C Gram-positive bacteria)]KQU28149.1 histidine kinase [Rhodococcus sp. Leaf225]KQU46259.1 histidine kinase [Rhodococcus sp. Leaf258]MBY6678555.1 GAF and ANTAR domain-containing protein [Rhodococcus sp. BP-332]MBY6686754.1 GAF and ANTAR domain-containing protein [Rhodococcus sp. BP-288]MBY6695616.1 GAF and ANTAR domain-containing protein [Rhodococcus sp. BP-188]